MLFLLIFFLCKMRFLNSLKQKSEYIKSFSCPLVSLYFLVHCKTFWDFLYSAAVVAVVQISMITCYRQKENGGIIIKKINRFKCLTHFQIVFMAFSLSFLPVANDKTIKNILIFLAMKFESIQKLFHHSLAGKSDIVFELINKICGNFLWLLKLYQN